ncbi:CheR family methyltransferase [Aminiphilus circumscriptus]|jgi:chemotaxis protein methyltransferase CheR|uniref:CheR family methyltransferase n=1 Tax=Aminiphilus circumscriptus TaxID=290732 RepID=UPI00047865C1|nr:protein-glutamate O-methyltransferase CheR [Aminiphilus circumscriptus]
MSLPNSAGAARDAFPSEFKEALRALGAEVEARLGLTFPENRRIDLWRAVRDFARESGEDAATVLARLAAAPLSEDVVTRLTPHLTVGETYFFREAKALCLFRDEALPALARSSGKELRLWCAGCSTGEEAYTLAMLVEEKAREMSLPPVRILGTDLNERFLEKARRGVYSKWSFRGVSDARREADFRREGDVWAVHPRFRKCVTFAPDNLVEQTGSPWGDSGAVDVIFCRNVLIYFAPPTIRRVLERFSRLLASGGWLFVASCETALVRRPAFVPVTVEGVTAFRKAPPEESPLRVVSAALGDGDSLLDGGVFFANEEHPFGSGGEGVEPFSVLAGKAGGEMSPEFSDAFGEELPEDLASDGGGNGVSAAIGHAPPSSEVSPEDAAYDAFRRGDWEEAERLLEPLAAHSASAGRLLVRLEADRGRHDRALDLCRQALDREKGDPVLFYLLSLIHQERGEDDEGAQALRRALYLDPDFVAAHYSLGVLALRGGRTEEVRRHFRNASTLLAGLPEDAPVPEMEDMSSRALLEAMRLLSPWEAASEGSSR